MYVRATLSFPDGRNRSVFDIVLAWISPNQRTSVKPSSSSPLITAAATSRGAKIVSSAGSIPPRPPLPPPPLPFVFPRHINVLPLTRLRAVHVSGGDLLKQKPRRMTAGHRPHLATVTFKSSEHVREVEQRRRMEEETKWFISSL